MRLCHFVALALATILTFAGAAIAADPVPVAGSATFGAGTPTGPSPDVNKNLYKLEVFYFDAAGNKQSTTVSIPDIAVTAGLPTPTAAQAAAASAAKAKAVVDAINKANVAVQPVNINGTVYNNITAIVDAKTIKGMYNTGTTKVQSVNGVPTIVPIFAEYDQTTYTVNGVRQRILYPGGPSAKLGAAIYQTGKNTTGEVGNGKFAFNAGSSAGGGGGANGSMYQGSFNGTGTGTGLSTGLDDSGNSSVVGFGFLDYSSSTPVDYIAAFDPIAGMTDFDIMTILAELFNEDFASAGFTASYDSILDVLSIDQLLPSTDMLWSANSDTGLLLDTSPNSVPEPSSLALLATAAGLGLLALQRRREIAQAA